MDFLFSFMEYKPDFFITPYVLIEDKRVKPLDERVYSTVYYFRKMRGQKCTASNETLAEIAKSTSKSVQNSLLRLEKLGYVLRTFKDKERKIRDEIIPLVTMGAFSDVPPVGDTVPPTDDTQVPPVGDQISNNIIRKSNEYSFESFWSIYPRKEKKKTTKQKWDRLSDEDKKKAIENVMFRIKNDDSWARGFIPHATTYINQERWDDEIAQPAQSGSTKSFSYIG